MRRSQFAPGLCSTPASSAASNAAAIRQQTVAVNRNNNSNSNRRPNENRMTKAVVTKAAVTKAAVPKTTVTPAPAATTDKRKLSAAGSQLQQQIMPSVLQPRGHNRTGKSMQWPAPAAMATPSSIQSAPSLQRSKRKNSTPKRSVVKKHKRGAPGTKVLRDIRRLQKSTDLLIRKLPFSRVVREIAHNLDHSAGFDHIKNFRWQTPAIACLHEASEAFLCDVFRMINLIAMHSRRVTVMPRDMDLLINLRDDIGHRLN